MKKALRAVRNAFAFAGNARRASGAPTDATGVRGELSFHPALGLTAEQRRRVEQGLETKVVGGAEFVMVDPDPKVNALIADTLAYRGAHARLATTGRMPQVRGDTPEERKAYLKVLVKTSTAGATRLATNESKAALRAALSSRDMTWLQSGNGPVRTFQAGQGLVEKLRQSPLPPTEVSPGLKQTLGALQAFREREDVRTHLLSLGDPNASAPAHPPTEQEMNRVVGLVDEASALFTAFSAAVDAW
jgi:hypothetical protein